MTTSSKISNGMYLAGAELLHKEFETVLREDNFMDLFAFNNNGDSCEIEVKVNDYDFYKEFTKPCKRSKHLAYKYHARMPYGFCPTRYYFMVPWTLEHRAITRIRKELSHYGLITYHQSTCKVKIIRKAKRMHEKPYIGEKLNFPFDKYIKHYRDAEKLRNEYR